MPHFEFIWLDHNIEHLADNGLAPEDAKNAMRTPTAKPESDSSGARAASRITRRTAARSP
jgi:hypothetical protein